MLRGTTASVFACTKKNQKININTRIHNTNLGELENNQEQTIRRAIMDKNPDPNSKFTFNIKDITTSTAKVEGTGEYTGTVDVTFTLKNDLSSFIKVKALGELENDQEATIRNAIKTKNPGIEKVTFDLKDITTSTAKVEGTGEYTGTVDVTFTIKKDISSFIKVKELGKINNNQETTITDAIISKNPTAQQATFTITNIQPTSAKVTGTGDFIGEVDVTYSIAKDISTLEKTLQNILNQHDETLLTVAEIQTLMKTAIPDSDGIGVVQTQVDPTIGAAGFEFNGEKSINYFGKLDLYQVLHKNTNNKTIYLDPNTEKISQTEDVAQLANAKQILNIGWDVTSKASIYNLPTTIVKVPNYISTSIQSIASLFKGLGQISDISGWNTSNITNMSHLFEKNQAFNGDISKWDTSNVFEMESMFHEAKSFNGDISKWNTAKLTSMNDIFGSASAFNQNISAWNTTLVTDMSYAFADATAFNQDILKWNTAKVTNMSYMFSNANAFNQDLSKWNVTGVTSHDNFATSPNWPKEKQPKFK
ncbi:BspA family leucine-rich repeat surface protein [Williamsoniiplasma luminosum]|nr:BspA family leucine-rich repeat surface protein [Williamsoniiplasma luminosum]